MSRALRDRLDRLACRILAGALGPVPRGMRLPAVLAEALSGAPTEATAAPREPFSPPAEETR